MGLTLHPLTSVEKNALAMRATATSSSFLMHMAMRAMCPLTFIMSFRMRWLSTPRQCLRTAEGEGGGRGGECVCEGGMSTHRPCLRTAVWGKQGEGGERGQGEAEWGHEGDDSCPGEEGHSDDRHSAPICPQQRPRATDNQCVFSALASLAPSPHPYTSVIHPGMRPLPPPSPLHPSAPPPSALT